VTARPSSMPTGSSARNARSERSCLQRRSARRRTAHPLGEIGGARREFSRRAPNPYQPACKPGSVWRAWLDARVTAIPLRRQLPDAFSNLPGRRDPDIDPGDCSPLAQRVAPCRPYSVLLPVGFALPPALPPTRCALTAPFHPYRPDVLRVCGGAGAAVCSLWHFP
jgi:hypothetical protein